MQSYLVKQKELNSRMKSRSGGTFAAVSDLVLAQGGVIYGAALDEHFMAGHCRATTAEERDCFRGSKYVQSSMGDTMKSVLADLQEGRTVLFSGTPCQVAGVKSFIPDELQGNLLCMDIVCHGVPSPRVWQDYLTYVSAKCHGKVTAVDFRNKRKHGWWEHVESYTVHGIERDSQVFERLFYEHNILRDCCYSCPYKSLNRVGDISLADAWGIAEANPEFDDNHGVSLVLCSTAKGAEWLTKAFATCDYLEVDIANYMQQPFKESFKKPDNYVEFWKRYFSMDFAQIVKGGYADSMKQKAKWRIKRIVKFFIPQSLINKIRGNR